MRKIFRPLAAQVLGLRNQLGKAAFGSRGKGRSSICAHHSAVLKGHFALSANFALNSVGLLNWSSNLLKSRFIRQQILDLNHTEQKNRQKEYSREFVDQKAPQHTKLLKFRLIHVPQRKVLLKLERIVCEEHN